MTSDPYAAIKRVRHSDLTRGFESGFTTPAALRLVEYAGVRTEQKVLDIGSGTGAVAIAAHRAGAHVYGLEFGIARLEEARWKASAIGAAIDFREGGIDALPYANDSFDIVISELGQVFAPNPDLVVREMMRLLKPGGRIAFSAWPSEVLMGQIVALTAKYLPYLDKRVSLLSWGNPEVARERLGDSVVDIEFETDKFSVRVPSLQHYCSNIEFTMEPVRKVVLTLVHDPVRLAWFRLQLEKVLGNWLSNNSVLQSYMLVRGIKR